MVAVEYGRYPIDFQFCPFNDSAAAQVIEIPLDPLGLQITQSANLKIHRYYPSCVAHFRMFQDDLKYAFRYRKLVHLPSSLKLLLTRKLNIAQERRKIKNGQIGGNQLDEVFEKARVDPKSVKLIILTHGHMDHVGTIAYAKQVTGGDVLCHQSYAQDLDSGDIEPATARNLTGRLLNFMTGLSGTKFEGVKPDIVVTDEFDLSEYGIAGKIIHTPGHSPSSLSIILDNGEALVGDIVREEEPGVIGLGMFYEDEQALLGSLEKIAAYEPSIIYLSHGNYIDNLALANAIRTIKAESGN
jgi:hydroxyacylglutathione hydrolase